MSTSAMQWREGAMELRRMAATWEGYAREAEATPELICGVISNCGPNGEPLACGYLMHTATSPHSWATLPTFVRGADQPEHDLGICNYVGSELGAFCDLSFGHEGGHYFHEPRGRDERLTPLPGPVLADQGEKP